MQLLLFVKLARLGQSIRLLINLPVPQASFDRFDAMDEDAFDPFVIEQPRAIDELVHHPGGKVGRLRRG